MRVVKVLAYLLFTLFLWVWWLNKTPEDGGITLKADTAMINKVLQNLSNIKIPEHVAPVTPLGKPIDSLYAALTKKIDSLERKMPPSFNPLALQPLQTSIEELKESIDLLKTKEHRKYIVFTGNNKLYSTSFIFFKCAEKSQISATATIDLILLEDAYKSTIVIEGLYTCSSNLKKQAPPPPPNLTELFILESTTNDNGRLTFKYKSGPGVDSLSIIGTIIGDTALVGTLKWGKEGVEFPIKLSKTD
jgi:hypothetical protein